MLANTVLLPDDLLVKTKKLKIISGFKSRQEIVNLWSLNVSLWFTPAGLRSASSAVPSSRPVSTTDSSKTPVPRSKKPGAARPAWCWEPLLLRASESPGSTKRPNQLFSDLCSCADHCKRMRTMMHFCHCVMLYSKHVLLRAYVVSSAWPSEHWRKLTNELLMLVAGNIAYTSTAMMI